MRNDCLDSLSTGIRKELISERQIRASHQSQTTNALKADSEPDPLQERSQLASLQDGTGQPRCHKD